MNIEISNGMAERVDCVSSVWPGRVKLLTYEKKPTCHHLGWSLALLCMGVGRWKEEEQISMFAFSFGKSMNINNKY